MLRAAADAAAEPVAITDADGALVCANREYVRRFGADRAPTSFSAELTGLAHAARRDGSAEGADEHVGHVAAETVGSGAAHLIWRFRGVAVADPLADAARLFAGDLGRRLAEAGLMAVLADAEGRVVAANSAFAQRAAPRQQDIAGRSLFDLVAADTRGRFHFASEAKSPQPLRVLQVPLGDGETPAGLFLLLDRSTGALSGSELGASLNALLDLMPHGLALADADGRFLYLNKRFRKAVGLAREEAAPGYPSDLVVDEDKSPLSDAVRRHARGPTVSADMSVRLKVAPDEPVPVTIAGVRGLGEGAVLLSMKDSSEEDKLKRQVAQATKMQAVGQLAGGVAHDFNNILTAIIGYCDLMLMRHTPGDSDDDDSQQIRSNSNRAAALTRQLLAFSRQQTLRPQVLQIPDVVAEVSTLLKRLLGETVTLQVKHGRNLGAVRADPGQLEQVIVNLAVNARDAMPGGGTVTLQTYAVSPDDVRRLGSDILPVGDYTALKVSDTGAGIPPSILGKIFEPFFTTKEVGKGTGLGLSTVYGIVKQSGGYIFAESEPGEGACFAIYLPVHHTAKESKVARRKEEKASELWGSGTILLVEDEVMVRAVAERALTRHGYQVLAAENGEAALEILAREPRIDLMISDVVMPTMDGPTTVREARKTHPDLPILFISGYAEEQLRKSIDLEKVAFLAKPFSVQKLAEAARDALIVK